MRKRRNLSGLRFPVTQNRVRLNYPDNYSYDLAGNQITKVQTTSAGTETTTNTYNGDNELTQSVDSSSGTTIYGYDANGSQTSSTNGSNVTTYTYDVRNRLGSVTTGGVTTTYGYDDAGNRVSETTAGTTTYYLIDFNNPTGYAKPIEVKVGSPTAAPTTSYILGLNVIGQANSSGTVSYLLVDGQGSTRSLTNASGVVTATFNYDAFGNAIGFNPATAPTIFLFGGDGTYDGPSGLYFHGSGRPSENTLDRFITANPSEYSSIESPITLNAYILDNADPVDNSDPTGWFTQGMGYAAEAAIESVYAIDHPGDTVSYGAWTRLGILGVSKAFRLKPDIFNTTTMRWAEIKPLSVSGIAKAVAQGGVYTLAFAPFKYYPDAGWTPSTHFAVAGTVPIVFFNVGGIIFYSDATDAAEDLIALTTIAAVRSFLASQLGQRIAQSLVDVLGERIPGLVATGASGDGAELGDSLGIGGLLGTLGFV